MKKVSIINYGSGNLLSVARAVEKVGSTPLLTNSENVILNSDRIILPGVGAFQNGIDQLKKFGLDEVLTIARNREIPILGICLGMQLLFDTGQEFGLSEGLGFIGGTVSEIPDEIIGGVKLKRPHIGWHQITICEDALNEFDKKMVSDIDEMDSFYHIHSYAAVPSNRENTIAMSAYGGHSLSTFVSNEMVFGCQFHPEKSGLSGLKIMSNFIGIF